MLGLTTNDLILKLVNYNFYDWEGESEPQHIYRLGMPQQILDDLGFPNFYDSWGYEAVQNIHADLPLLPKHWLTLEQTFFNWLKKAKDILFPNGTSIVTPELSTYWLPYEKHPPNWTKKNKWEKPDYDSYVALLQEAGIINLEPASLKENLRGAIVQDYREFETLGKIAARNQPLLFFANEDRVIRVTEYLSILIELKEEETYRDVQRPLIETLNPQFLM